MCRTQVAITADRFFSAVTGFLFFITGFRWIDFKFGNLSRHKNKHKATRMMITTTNEAAMDNEIYGDLGNIMELDEFDDSLASEDGEEEEKSPSMSFDSLAAHTLETHERVPDAWGSVTAEWTHLVTGPEGRHGAEVRKAFLESRGMDLHAAKARMEVMRECLKSKVFDAMYKYAHKRIRILVDDDYHDTFAEYICELVIEEILWYFLYWSEGRWDIEGNGGDSFVYRLLKYTVPMYLQDPFLDVYCSIFKTNMLSVILMDCAVMGIGMIDAGSDEACGEYNQMVVKQGALFGSAKGDDILAMTLRGYYLREHPASSLEKSAFFRDMQAGEPLLNSKTQRLDCYTEIQDCAFASRWRRHAGLSEHAMFGLISVLDTNSLGEGIVAVAPILVFRNSVDEETKMPLMQILRSHPWMRPYMGGSSSDQDANVYIFNMVSDLKKETTHVLLWMDYMLNHGKDGSVQNVGTNSDVVDLIARLWINGVVEDTLASA